MSAATRRLIIAFAVSIALHEAGAGLIPSRFASAPPPREIVVRARIVRIATAPTLQPILHPSIARLHPIVLLHRRASHRVSRRTQRRHGGAALARAPASLALRALANRRPVWDLGENHTAAVSSRTGTGTAAGVGAGAGANGSGGGAGDATEPCGFVTFSDPHGSRYDPSTGGFWVDIRMSVHFADGSLQSLVLDYPWYYPSEAANPWSSENLKYPNFPTRFQAPPADKLQSEPPLVHYVAQHSTADGMTLLRDCPLPAPSPAAESPRKAGALNL